MAQARVAGADAVMLYASLLEGASLGVMIHAARRYGIEAVGVAHDEAGLARLADTGVALIAVACREPATWAEAPDVVQVPVQALRIGDIAIMGTPVETFAEMGLDLKARAPIIGLFDAGGARMPGIADSRWSPPEDAEGKSVRRPGLRRCPATGRARP